MDLTNINDIRALLERHGFRFSRSMGQNFLTSSWVPEDIAESAELDGDTGVLEIGPGVGCLTEQLSLRAGKVVAVELDTALRPVLRETLSGRDNVEVIFDDVLKLDIPALLDERLSGMRHVVCANPPYNVTKPVLLKLLTSREFDTVTVMIQREVVQKICSGVGDAGYGEFSVLVNWYAEPEPLFDVPPDCFVPQPKVTSTVVRLRCRKAPQVPVKSEKMLLRVVRAAFAQRRKTLSNALSISFGEIGKQNIENCLAECGFDPKIRGEALAIGDFAKIADAFCKVLD